MRIVYGKTMLEKISQARRDALKEQKEIEKIVLTVPEARKMQAEMFPLGCFTTATQLEWDRWLYYAEHGVYPGPQPEIKVLGIKIEVER